MTETNEQYHADRLYYSRSQLWDAWQRPSVFHAKHIARTMRSDSSKAMDKGTLLHAAILEPEKDILRTYPRELLSVDGKASTKAAKEWKAEQDAAGFVVINESDAFDVSRMTESVRAVTGKWMKEADLRETSLRWVDSESGLPLKCRPDWIANRGEKTLVFDLKTTSELTKHGFRASCRDYGYWLQASMYSDGVSKVLELPGVEFLFVVVESSAPYKCGIFRFAGDTLHRARLAQEELLVEVARRIDQNDWRDPVETQINEIELHTSCFER